MVYSSVFHKFSQRNNNDLKKKKNQPAEDEGQDR